MKITCVGVGHVPSFKNKKRIGRKHLYTNPKVKEWMENVIQLIESQVRSMYQTTAGATSTGCSLQSWIASSVPLDDSRQWMDPLIVMSEECKKGEEGFTLTIEKL